MEALLPVEQLAYLAPFCATNSPPQARLLLNLQDTQLAAFWHVQVSFWKGASLWHGPSARAEKDQRASCGGTTYASGQNAKAGAVPLKPLVERQSALANMFGFPLLKRGTLKKSRHIKPSHSKAREASLISCDSNGSIGHLSVARNSNPFHYHIWVV